MNENEPAYNKYMIEQGRTYIIDIYNSVVIGHTTCTTQCAEEWNTRRTIYEFMKK